MNNEQNMKKELAKIRYTATGVCAKCGKEFVRDAEVDTAVCTCASVVEVNLTITAILPASLERYFNELARLYGCTSDDVYNACFEVGFDNVPELLRKRQLEAQQ